MSFLIEDYEMLQKYNKIWEKASNTIKKVFDSKLIDNEQYLKTKIKSCLGRIKKDLYGKDIPEEGSHAICLSVILVDSVFKNGKSYYSQVFLQCKYIIAEKKARRYINVNFFR